MFPYCFLQREKWTFVIMDWYFNLKRQFSAKMPWWICLLQTCSFSLHRYSNVVIFYLKIQNTVKMALSTLEILSSCQCVSEKFPKSHKIKILNFKMLFELVKKVFVFCIFNWTDIMFFILEMKRCGNICSPSPSRCPSQCCGTNPEKACGHHKHFELVCHGHALLWL